MQQKQRDSPVNNQLLLDGRLLSYCWILQQTETWSLKARDICVRQQPQRKRCRSICISDYVAGLSTESGSTRDDRLRAGGHLPRLRLGQLWLPTRLRPPDEDGGQPHNGAHVPYRAAMRRQPVRCKNARSMVITRRRRNRSGLGARLQLLFPRLHSTPMRRQDRLMHCRFPVTPEPPSRSLQSGSFNQNISSRPRH